MAATIFRGRGVRTASPRAYTNLIAQRRIYVRPLYPMIMSALA
jgi:hypothetical protein